MSEPREPAANENAALRRYVGELEAAAQRETAREANAAYDPAVRAALESEQRLRSTMDAMLEGCQILGHDWRYLYLNEAAAAQARMTAEQLLGQRFTDAWPGVESTELHACMRRVLEQRVNERMVNEFAYPDGARGWFDLRMEPVPEGILVLSVDVTDARRDEARSRHLTQVLAAIRTVNQLIVREKSPAALVQKTCEALVATRSYHSAWIVLGGDDGSPTLVAQTGSGESFVAFREQLEAGWRPPCWQQARRSPERIAVLSPQPTCEDCPLGYAGLDGAVAVARLSHEGVEHGMLGICREPGHLIDHEEAALLLEVADDLGLALSGIEAERRRHAFEQIVENSQDAMALVGRDHRYLEANPAYARFAGRNERGLPGRHVAEVLGREFYDTVARKNLDRALAGETVTFHAPWSKEGSAPRFTQAQYSPCRAADGTVIAVAVSVRDVTVQRTAEDALRESEERLSVCFHHSPIGIVMTSMPDGRIVDVNAEFARMHGYERADLIGHTGSELNLWADVEAREEMLRQLREHRTCKNFEIRSRRRDGQLRDLQISVELVSIGGEPFTLGLAQDITERKSALEVQRAQNAILLSQSEASLDGILVLDENNRYRFRNRRFAEIWNVPEQLFRDHDEEGVRALVASQMLEPEAFLARLREIMADRQMRAEEELRLADGRVIERYTAPMYDPEGRYVGRLWYFRDVTERRRAEEQRARLEEQLRAAQKMEAIGTLAGGVAHDFNNLLLVILNYTQFALDALHPDDPLRGDLVEVNRAGERAAALTRQLLAFSRKQVLQPMPVNLNMVAEGLERMLRRILGEDVEFTLDLAPDLGIVLADPGQLEQVLMNVVVNARDAMPEGGALTIATRNVDLGPTHAREQVEIHSGPYVELAVTDTGTGMDEATRSRVFEPFFTTKDQGRGTGLGLSTTYGIVKQSGGYIWVDSEPGMGTRFTIHLPREKSTAFLEPRPVAARSSATGDETLLVTEDEEALRGLLRRLLEDAGYRVLTASDGADALNVAAAHPGPIHLLLTDVVMPRLGGRNLAVELAKTRPATKVLYMSGYTDDAIANHGILDPGTHFLGKPFAADDLIHTVRDILDGADATCADASRIQREARAT